MLFVSDPGLLAALEGVDMAEVAITVGASRCCRCEAAPEGASGLPTRPDVAVVDRAARAGGNARARGRYSEEVGSDPDYPDVTLRDAAALREYDAAQQAAE